MTNPFALPPRIVPTEETKDTERLYRTALPSKDYLRLEIESMERGLKPFGLTKSIMTLYVNKQLIYLPDLPQEIQELINEHYLNTQTLNTTKK